MVTVPQYELSDVRCEVHPHVVTGQVSRFMPMDRKLSSSECGILASTHRLSAECNLIRNHPLKKTFHLWFLCVGNKMGCRIDLSYF